MKRIQNLKKNLRIKWKKKQSFTVLNSKEATKHFHYQFYMITSLLNHLLSHPLPRHVHYRSRRASAG